MGISKQQVAENREAILDAAARLFREKGVDAVGLTELTRAAGFTQGGFYNHFKSKEDLVAAVVEKVMGDSLGHFVAVAERTRESGVDPLEQRIDWYLSSNHRDTLESGCPLSGFAGDVRRFGKPARMTYASALASNLQQYADLIAERNGSKQGNRDEAIVLFSQLVGAVVLSRAVAEADRLLADEFLNCGLQHFHSQLLG